MPPVRWFTTPDVVIVYPWIAGRVLNHATLAGSDRAGLDMFRRLGVVEIEAAIGDVLDAHLVVADRGFVAVDFYDGCLLYDFECRRMHLIDLDEYRPGPFTVEADRLPGSTSYMAPEELTHGSEIDQRTTVFNLGRMIHHLLDGPAGWRGTAAQLAIVTRATQVSPDCRNQNVGELTAEWTARHS